MKKLRYLAYVVALMFTVGLVACTSSTKKTEEKVETPAEEVVAPAEEVVAPAEAVTDSSAVEEAPATEEVVEESAE